MSNYKLKFSTQFKKDFKKISLNQRKLSDTKAVFEILIEFGSAGIPISMKPHQLKGKLKNHWECHVQPDLLLIWLVIDFENKLILLERIGSHTEILKM